MRYTENVLDDSPELSAAYMFSKKEHDKTGAVRKYSKEPYFVHPEVVSELAVVYGGNKAESEAALLHDVIEDTPITYQTLLDSFGEEVADIVYELTNNEIEKKKYGKEAYINNKLLELSDSALFVKLCDMLHNMTDHPQNQQWHRMKKNIDYLIENRDLDDRESELVDTILSVAEKYENSDK